MILGVSDVGAIVITFALLLVTAGLGVLFFFLIKRNINKEKEASQVIVENAITKKAMEESIRGYIKKVDRFGAMALLYVDIDGFGDLNEIFGHDACDDILKEIALEEYNSGYEEHEKISVKDYYSYFGDIYLDQTIALK